MHKFFPFFHKKRKEIQKEKNSQLTKNKRITDGRRILLMQKVTPVPRGVIEQPIGFKWLQSEAIVVYLGHEKGDRYVGL